MLNRKGNSPQRQQQLKEILKFKSTQNTNSTLEFEKILKTNNFTDESLIKDD